jgi:hypothetical protein
MSIDPEIQPVPHVPSSKEFIEDVMCPPHEHRFTESCFTCGDRENVRCACGTCLGCGDRTNWYEIEREQIEFDKTRWRRKP